MCKNLLSLVLVLVLAGSAYAVTGHWTMDDDASTSVVLDRSGNHGTFVDPTGDSDTDAHHSADFMRGTGSLYFDGTDDYITLPESYELERGDDVTANLRFSFWFKPDLTAPPSNFATILGTGDGGWFVGTFENEDQLIFVTWASGNLTILPCSAVSVYDNDWHYAEGVFDSENGMQYLTVDGTEVSATLGAGVGARIQSNGKRVLFGSNAGTGGRYWQGLVDNALIKTEADPVSLVAWAPDPDGVSNIALNTDLQWNIPTDANEISWFYEVYFDTDSTFASTTPVTVGPLEEDEYQAVVTSAQIGGPLSIGTYYWRVDSIDPNEPSPPGVVVTRTGDLWSFDAGATLPTLVAPTDDFGNDVEINVDLVWSSDPIVTASNVYIKVSAGTWVNVGTQTSPFDPYTYGLTDEPDELTMAWDTDYVWQVEELDAGSNVLAVGPEWKFGVRALDCVGVTADIDGSADCVVDLADFAAMASQWLDCGWNDSGMASPCP